MACNVIVTQAAEQDLDNAIVYLLFEKKNEQAAKNLLDDFEETIDRLKIVDAVFHSLQDYENQMI